MKLTILTAQEFKANTVKNKLLYITCLPYLNSKVYRCEHVCNSESLEIGDIVVDLRFKYGFSVRLTIKKTYNKMKDSVFYNSYLYGTWKHRQRGCDIEGVVSLILFKLNSIEP